MITIQTFNLFLLVMAVIAVAVFIALFFIDAGYGKFYQPKWGPAIDNHLGWFLMEVPVFVAMLVLWWFSDRRADGVRMIFLLLFEIHYFHRSFIFPRQLRGHSRMPLAIVLMGALFNTLNALMQGGWIFYLSPADFYPKDWLVSLPFLAGTLLFFAGMYINIQSDSIIRNLRKPGDTAHYLPKGGMFRYVTSANYFGEFTEWVGFAILTWSWSGAVFALWTFANLAPRAARIYDLYSQEFPDELDTQKVKRMLPFIY
ncbi:MAG: 3-oxo-5-alpha-steroid 4-dehydrogenase [Bacteroidales bacterium]|nr:3-oxo-5-alpha-steroid 4-dehydrogenase [Bacteroidales bacterium]